MVQASIKALLTQIPAGKHFRILIDGWGCPSKAVAYLSATHDEKKFWKSLFSYHKDNSDIPNTVHII